MAVMAVVEVALVLRSSGPHLRLQMAQVGPFGTPSGSKQVLSTYLEPWGRASKGLIPT